MSQQRDQETLPNQSTPDRAGTSASATNQGDKKKKKRWWVPRFKRKGKSAQMGDGGGDGQARDPNEEQGQDEGREDERDDDGLGRGDASADDVDEERFLANWTGAREWSGEIEFVGGGRRVRWSATFMFTSSEAEDGDEDIVFQSAQLHKVLHEMGSRLCGGGEEIGDIILGAGNWGFQMSDPSNAMIGLLTLSPDVVTILARPSQNFKTRTSTSVAKLIK
jgi:hypothetical protein